jgi:hypothetical protein
MPAPDHWRPWHRLLGDAKCATCGQTTRHAFLRDHDPEGGRNHAEVENYRSALLDGVRRRRLNVAEPGLHGEFLVFFQHAQQLAEELRQRPD